jgi:hypothetical protein
VLEAARPLLVFLVVGVGIYQAVAPGLFPRPEGGGSNVSRILIAAVVGAVCAVPGAGVGGLIDHMRK